MVKAIVFFDLDGTLFQDDKSLAPDTLQAIQAMRANDSLPVIATGRNRFEIQYVLDQTGIDSLVAANGSYVQIAGQRQFAEVIPTPLVQQLTDYATALGDPVGWYNESGFALSAENADTAENYQLLHLTPHVDPQWPKHHDVNFMFVFDRGREGQFQTDFAQRLSLVRNNIRGLDTMLAGVSKQTGITHLLTTSALKGVPTYAFGDEANDLPMLQLVDHPVAMGNGSAAVKQVAEFVTTSNMAHGIAHGLKHYGLI
ncbi:Cof-type HAD-IIB family hydrolase [Lacticaseibacillus baoqingensis]|uniref:Cof-type HAD-IIB family hydrolase n=1 Tax=Lacticaseibacillus baoqingensis TaxID=2486013 RepID=A0ABW4E1S4_9LACO|nr:Cof-type HAD-IIB family hydrolase [Lacticaseibacillus baoqingensis]